MSEDNKKNVENTISEVKEIVKSFKPRIIGNFFAIILIIGGIMLLLLGVIQHSGEKLNVSINIQAFGLNMSSTVEKLLENSTSSHAFSLISTAVAFAIVLKFGLENLLQSIMGFVTKSAFNLRERISEIRLERQKNKLAILESIKVKEHEKKKHESELAHERMKREKDIAQIRMEFENEMKMRENLMMEYTFSNEEKKEYIIDDGNAILVIEQIKTWHNYIEGRYKELMTEKQIVMFTEYLMNTNQNLQVMNSKDKITIFRYQFRFVISKKMWMKIAWNNSGFENRNGRSEYVCYTKYSTRI